MCYKCNGKKKSRQIVFLSASDIAALSHPAPYLAPRSLTRRAPIIPASRLDSIDNHDHPRGCPNDTCSQIPCNLIVDPLISFLPTRLAIEAELLLLQVGPKRQDARRGAKHPWGITSIPVRLVSKDPSRSASHVPAAREAACSGRSLEQRTTRWLPADNLLLSLLKPTAFYG